jgi:alpha-ketoglutarate-dependent 2,4-dichlorophenoxyacetate dioxygenase
LPHGTRREADVPLAAKPLHPLFAAEVSGVDIAAPLDDAATAEIAAAIIRHGVVVFRRGRPLTDEQHIAFARNFGPLQQMKMLTMLANQKRRVAYAELVDVGNLDENGNILPDDDRRRLFNRGNALWHTDVSFDANRATFSFLAAHTIPPAGADTEFADMRAAYDALPQAMKRRIDGLSAEHSIWYSRALAGFADVSQAEKAMRPPAVHPLVHVRPGSTRKSLYIASHASHVVGWPVEEGRALLDELTGFATRPQYVYRHTWAVGDLVIWDNLATMHRATPFDDTRYPRDMRRTTCLERAA